MAVNEFKDALQQAIACVTRSILLVSANGYRETIGNERPHSLSIGSAPVRLGGAGQIALSVDHHYRIVRTSEGARYRITTAAYYYSLDDVSVRDVSPREIIAYHWHPDVTDGTGCVISYPHLHIGQGAVSPALFGPTQPTGGRDRLRPDLADAHLPTRRIALEDVLRLAIEQFGAQPINRNWDTALRASREFFKATRAWI